MTGSRLIIEFSHPDIMKPKPWPVAIDLETGKAISGLGNDDGATLIGFGMQGEQSVDVWFTPGEDTDGITELIKGMVPTFSGSGAFFEWGNPIRSARIQEPVTDKHFRIDIQMSNSEMQEPAEVAEALQKIVWQLTEGGMTLAGETDIRDVNGHKVGQWDVVEVAR